MPTRWTEEEEEYIRVEYARGCTLFGMALVLNRSPNAIYRRLLRRKNLERRNEEAKLAGIKSANIPNKTVKLSGNVDVGIEGNKLTVEATDGYCVTIVADAYGSEIWAYHPLSGWYIEGNMQHGGENPNEQ